MTYTVENMWDDIQKIRQDLMELDCRECDLIKAARAAELEEHDLMKVIRLKEEQEKIHLEISNKKGEIRSLLRKIEDVLVVL